MTCSNFGYESYDCSLKYIEEATTVTVSFYSRFLDVFRYVPLEMHETLKYDGHIPQSLRACCRMNHLI